MATLQWGRRVKQYLDNEGSEFTVHDDIEAEYFEAGAASRVAGKTRSIVVTQRRVGRDESLDDDVVDLIPQPLHVMSVLLQPTVHCRYPPAARQRHRVL